MIRWIERIAGVFDHLWSLQILFKIRDFDRKNLTIIRVFAKAEFTNLNVTKKVRILFVESEVEVGLRKRNRFSTKYLTGRKKTWVGIICGVVPQNSKILWNSWPLFYGIPQYFLVRRIFCPSLEPLPDTVFFMLG